MGAERKMPTTKRTLVKVPIHDRTVEDIIDAITPFANRTDRTPSQRPRPARTYLNAAGELCILVERYGA